jgi:hypothetical protein
LANLRFYLYDKINQDEMPILHSRKEMIIGSGIPCPSGQAGMWPLKENINT